MTYGDNLYKQDLSQMFYDKMKHLIGMFYRPRPVDLLSIVDFERIRHVKIATAKLINDVEQLEKELKKIGIRIRT